MKRLLFLLPVVVGGCTTTQTFTLTDLVTAAGTVIDLLQQFGVIAPGSGV